VAIEYHINERDELITLTASGAVSSADACGCIAEMLKDQAFDANLPQLIDLRAAEPTGNAEELEAFETFLLGNYQPRLGSTVAIVVNEDWDESTCARAFWVSCALGLAELFDDWNQACKWLVTREFTADLANTPGLESLQGIFEEAFLAEDDWAEGDCAKDDSEADLADAEGRERSWSAEVANTDSDPDYGSEHDADVETTAKTDRATPLDH